MLFFFISIYYALLTGNWSNFNAEPNLTTIKTFIGELGGNITTFLMNALGGNFETLQNFNIFDSTIFQTSGTSTLLGIAIILSFITMVGVCFAVWKIVKSLFFIFFEGWR